MHIKKPCFYHLLKDKEIADFREIHGSQKGYMAAGNVPREMRTPERSTLGKT